MLAGLAAVGPWLRGRFRASLPPAGPAYDLYDLAAVVTFAPLAWYAVGMPSPASLQVLSWLTSGDALRAWGIALSLCGLVGMFCAYAGRVALGAGVIGGACFLWSLFLVMGLFLDSTTLLFALVLIAGWWTTTLLCRLSPAGLLGLWVAMLAVGAFVGPQAAPLGTAIVFGYLARGASRISLATGGTR